MQSSLLEIPLTDNRSFIVPLDALDLKSLLDLRSKDRSPKNLSLKNYERVPIWRKKPELDTEEYYEFEINSLPNKPCETQNQCSKTFENTDHCYICDLAIPPGYMQTHCQGVKHTTCAAILSHALHRANQHMTKSVSLPHSDNTTKIQPVFVNHEATYYCDQCAAVIKVENKDEHEITKAHKKSVAYDRQLQNFLALLVDKVVMGNCYCNDVNEDTGRESKGLSETLDVQGKIITNENSEVIFSVDANQPYKAATVEYNDEFVTLKTLKGESMRVPADNYHGFSRGDNGVQCRVCRKMVDNTTRHKLESLHVELVTAAVADKHCIRCLTDILNHCILCNEIIGDPLSHTVNNEQHINLLKQYKVYARCKSNTDDYYCSYCDLTVEKSQKKRHKNSIDHRLKMYRANTKMHHHLKATEVLCEILCRICNIVLENHQDVLDEHLQSYDHERNYEALLASNKIRKIGDCISMCQICHTRLIDMEVLHHIAGAKHIVKIQKWQDSVLLDSKREHALLKLKEDEIIADDSDILESSDEMSADELCDMVFKRTQPQQHYLMELCNDVQVKCRVCDVKIDNNDDVIYNHIETNNHKFNYDTALNYNKIQVVEGGDEFKFYCEYCKVQVNEKSEIDHINEYLHSCERDFIKQLQSLNSKTSDDYSKTIDEKDLKSNTEEVLNTKSAEKDAKKVEISENVNRVAYFCDICNTIFDNSVRLHYESETHKKNLDQTFTDTPKHYLMAVKKQNNTCKVCKVRVPNNVQNIQDHIDGRNHINTYNFILNLNKIKKVNVGFYCEICKKAVEDTLEVNHIDTDTHVANKKKHDKIVANKKDSKKKDPAVVKKDLNTEDDTKKNADKVNSVNTYYCDVCEVGVPNYPHNIKEHSSGLRHKSNMDKIMAENNISLKKKNTYRCDMCQVYFSKASLMKHVNSEKHTIGMKRFGKYYK